MITTEVLEQEIFHTYSLFPDKDVSESFNNGMIYTMHKYGIITHNQAENAYKYNRHTHQTFE